MLSLCIAMFGILALPVSAASGTGFPPPPTCFPGVGPCQETEHFGEVAFFVTPLPGCPLPFSESAFIDQKGNGIEHINVNNAQDAWFTTTMEGAATVVLGTISFDSSGNPIFTPDLTKPTFAGQLQQWFGGEFNNRNVSLSFTVNLQATGSDGSSASLHLNAHINTTGNAPFTPNPNSMHFNVNCI